ncbi:hypothetical protein J6590_076974 [Homalodisca vitripennis]|nr:hypothetical protein J6590_076974 [Homalodisca vitripennis]
MEAERVFLACTDYAPVPAGLFESLSTQVRRLTKIESTVDYCLAFTAINLTNEFLCTTCSPPPTGASDCYEVTVNLPIDTGRLHANPDAVIQSCRTALKRKNYDDE